MKRALIGLIGPLALLPASGFGRGVSPYLPLNLEPEVERQIERVLILAGKPVMTRPIAAATVLDALPKACKRDAVLCARVRGFLSHYMQRNGVAYASVEASGSNGTGASSIEPNRYGMRQDSHWNAAAQIYMQPSDNLLVDIGAVAYEGKTSFSGSMISLGWSWAQLDVGFRPHWFSPLSDSSMLMSTEAPTMPSWTISNYEPLTRFGFSYQIFEAKMSESHKIVWQDGYTSGNPRLGGVQVTMEPATGWSISLNRLAQFGGGARGNGSLSQLLKALFNPSRYSNTTNANLDQDATNQEASVTSSFLFTGRIPFAVYAEYAGEDTSRGRNYLLGNSALSWGIRFPQLARHFDLTLEASEWQNGWYTNSVYQDGMTNDGLVTGHWFGDQRVFNDGVGGRSAMARLGWDAWFGGQFEFRYRTLENETYGANTYKRYQELTVGYSRPWSGLIVGGEINTGRDVFGGNFTRVAGFLRLGERSSDTSATEVEDERPGDPGNELFIDAGVNSLRIRTDLTETTPKTTGPMTQGVHIALGARRRVSEHSDLGARVELDEIRGDSLIGVRLLDYRYRFNNPLAITAFVGAARYSLATPAYGFYYGLGLQWRDLLPHMDAGVDVRYYDSVARDHLLPSDPHTARPDSFYDVFGGVFSLTYHF
ncbi:MAG TPA: capsule assembly Wzi family protein [Candidatus Krumholzibacteria bacterium]|nr:capsule assembly Wzi family protein [Candidatus Krumholzibacteria bacterium]